MKLTILQEDFSRAVTHATRFSSQKAQLPMLSNLLLSGRGNTLYISSTNLENSISLSIGAKIAKTGEIAIPAKILSDLVSNLKPGQIEFEVKKEKVNLTSENFNSTLLGMNAAEFPSVPSKVGKNKFSAERRLFINALNQTLFSVSTDDTRPVLTGVLMFMKKNHFVFVSTDGFRLSYKKIKIKGSFTNKDKIIVPKNVLAEFVRLAKDKEEIELSINKAESQIIFGVGNNMILSSRIIEGEFPDFKRIIPKTFEIKIEIDKEELLRAIKISAVFARDSANVVKFSVFRDNVEVSSESPQGGNQSVVVEAKVEGGSGKKEFFSISYNYRYVEELLGVIESDLVTIKFKDTTSPGVFLDPNDSSFLHLIMPVKV